MSKVCRSCFCPAPGAACLQVRTCTHGNVGAGVAVDARLHSTGALVASGVTNSAGKWCPPTGTLPSATYDFTCSGTGFYTTPNASVVWNAAVVGVAAFANAQLLTENFGTAKLTFQFPCGGACYFPTLTLTGPSGFSATHTYTSINEVYTVSLGGPGTYSWTATTPASARYQTITGTFVNPTCGGSTINVAVKALPATGYGFFAWPTIGAGPFCRDAVSVTLFATDTLLGVSGVVLTGTLNANGCITLWTNNAVTFTFGDCRFTGFPGPPGCHGGTVVGTLDSNLGISFPTDSVTGCPGGDGLGGTATVGSPGGPTVTSSIVTCPPGYVWTGSITAADSGGFKLYCGQADTWTISE